MTKRTAIDQIEFMRNLLAFLLVGAFIGAMAAFTILTIPEGNKDILTYMIGQLSGMAITVLGFYFVSKVGQDALDQSRSDNTKEAFKAVQAAASGAQPSVELVGDAVDEVAGAAVDKADELKG